MAEQKIRKAERGAVDTDGPGSEGAPAEQSGSAPPVADAPPVAGAPPVADAPVVLEPGEMVPKQSNTRVSVGIDPHGSEGVYRPDVSETAPEVTESVEQPGKVMRIGSMVKQLLDEVRNSNLDEASRNRLRDIHRQSIVELASALSPDLAAELDRMALPFENETPSEGELRIAQAQLVGWLEGLFHGIQATLVAQQMAARQQLEEMRHRGLPMPGDAPDLAHRPGTYL